MDRKKGPLMRLLFFMCEGIIYVFERKPTVISRPVIPMIDDVILLDAYRRKRKGHK